MPKNETSDRIDANASSLPKTWLEELDGRREEAIKVALRNFLVSRQFTTSGSLAEAERVARFYEGVVMSLQPNPSIDAFDAATRAFKDVLRYEGTPRKDSRSASNQEGLWGKHALRIQAVYNLAVLFHRRAVQLREVGAGVASQENQPAILKESVQPDGKGQIYQAGEKDRVMTPLLTADPLTAFGAIPPQPRHMETCSESPTAPSVDPPTNDKNSTDDSNDPRKESLCEAATRYKDCLRAIGEWGLKYEDWERYKQPSEENTWKKIILETGVAAIVGDLLLEVESREGHSLPVLTEERRGELKRRLNDARSVLLKSRTELRSSKSSQDVRQHLRPLEQSSPEGEKPNKTLLDRIFSRIKAKLDDFKVQLKYGKPLGSEMLHEEMLQQLHRVAERLALYPKASARGKPYPPNSKPI